MSIFIMDYRQIDNIKGEYDVAKLALELGGSDMNDAEMSVFLSETMCHHMRLRSARLQELSKKETDVEELETLYSRINRLHTMITKLRSRTYKENVKKEYKCIMTVLKRNQNSVGNKNTLLTQ